MPSGASTYPVDLAILTGGGEDTWAGISAAHLAAYGRYCPLRAGHDVLEVGCGVGSDAIPLTDILGAGGSYLGVDVSGPSIAWFRSTSRVVVVAAGNDGRDNSVGENGYGTINSPGNDPYVITVGAMKTEGTITRSDDLIASYSSKGPTLYDHYSKPDLVAPGNLVVSTLPPGMTLANLYPQNTVTGNYFMLSGTSMATPVVSAAAALLLQQNSKWNPDQVKARLMETATKNFPVSSIAVDLTTGVSYVSYYDTYTVGAGYLGYPGSRDRQGRSERFGRHRRM